MPIYCYKCDNCGDKVQMIRSWNSIYDPWTCENCGVDNDGEETVKITSDHGHFRFGYGSRTKTDGMPSYAE